MKLFKNLLLSGLIMAVLSVGVVADSEAPEWVDFYGNVTVNGVVAPIGTIVEAYDPDGVMCGSYTVTNTAGIYGFLHANRDDVSTPGTDEGANPGDSITLKVNGIVATPSVVSGGLTWTSNGDQNNIDLAITGQTIAFTAVTLPTDTLAAPGWIIEFVIDIRNDGNGTDFYYIEGGRDTSASPAWAPFTPFSYSYANPGDTTSIILTISLPIFGGGLDTSLVIPYTVFSVIDTTVRYTDSVTIYKSITDIGDDNLANVPDRFNLFQNYPNPFNPTTNISFSLSQKSSVRIEIVNINGQLVDVKNLGIMPVGTHQIEYDASKLSSGVYFYRMTTDNGSVSKKMVLLK